MNVTSKDLRRSEHAVTSARVLVLKRQTALAKAEHELTVARENHVALIANYTRAVMGDPYV